MGTANGQGAGPDQGAGFGRWVRARRTELLLTQDELAERSGLGGRAVRDLEAGRGGPPAPETQRRLIAVLRAAEPSTVESGPAELPPAVAAFTGRVAELKELDRVLARPGGPVLAIAGMAGVGKTALAVHWARRVRHRFPGGQLYADLFGYPPGDAPLRSIEVLARLLHAMGVPGDQIPADEASAVRIYRSSLANRRILIVLDNVADPAQIRALLPVGTGNLVLVTSREPLAGVARGMMTLDALPPEDSHKLLARVVGADRVAAEPAAAAELVRLCAGLPLALRIAAAHLHSRPDTLITEYVALLANLAPADLSYMELPEPAQRLFRRLGGLPGPDFSAETAAVVAGLDPADTAAHLDILVRSHLIEPRSAARFGFQTILRRYARQHADPAERQDARRRLLDHYEARVAGAASRLYGPLRRLPGPTPREFPDATQAYAWLDAERAGLVAAIEYAAEHGPRPAAWRLADGLRGYFGQSMYTVDWLTCAEAGLRAARTEGDLAGQAAAQLSLATLYSRLGDHRRAFEGYSWARDLARQAGWNDGEVTALGGLGDACVQLGRAREATAHFTAILEYARKAAERAAVLSSLGLLSLDLGRLALAADQHVEALALARQSDSTGLVGNSMAHLAEAYLGLGHVALAQQYVTEALAFHRETGDRDGEGSSLALLAAVHRDRGDLPGALRLARQAVALSQAAGHPRYEVDAHNVLGTVHCRLRATVPATEHHGRALRLARDSGYRYATTTALLGLAGVHRELGEPRPARARLVEALEIAEDAGYPVPVGNARALIGRLCLDEGQVEAAIGYAERAVEVLRPAGHRLGEARALTVLADAIGQLGRKQEARAARTAAAALLAEIA